MFPWGCSSAALPLTGPGLQVLRGCLVAVFPTERIVLSVCNRVLAFPRVDASAYANRGSFYPASASGGFISADFVPRVDTFLTILLIFDWCNHSYLFVTAFHWCRCFSCQFLFYISHFFWARGYSTGLPFRWVSAAVHVGTIPRLPLEELMPSGFFVGHAFWRLKRFTPSCGGFA